MTRYAKYCLCLESIFIVVFVVIVVAVIVLVSRSGNLGAHSIFMYVKLR
jgi:hypothetical protein